MSERLTDEQLKLLEEGYEHFPSLNPRDEVKKQLIADLRHYKQENASLLQVVEEQKKALEWANRIIGSGLDMSSPLRYDPVSWNIEYHEKWK